MNKQELKKELDKGRIVEFSNESDIFEVRFSTIRGKFMLMKNSELIKSTERFTNLIISLPLHKLELTDIFE